MVRSQLISILVITLVLFGLLMVGSASIVDASRDFGDKWYYLKLQLLWSFFGFIGFLFFSNFSHRRLEKYASPLLVATLVLLVAVLIPGIGMKLMGARRWINLGVFSFQPAEIAKLALCVYWAKLFQRPVPFMSFAFVLGLMGGLIMLEPDLGTALVLVGMSVTAYFGSANDYKPLLIFAPVAIMLVGLLVLTSPYRLNRLRTFLDHNQDKLGTSYHIHQALLGFGSGGIWGVGLGQSRQKYEYLPEATTDSIFSIIGEELGLLGTIGLVGLFLYLITLCLQVATSAAHPFSSILALSITGWIGVQAFLNISAIIALVPLTGIPLTFISYGGSSLFLVMVSMGIIVNISKAQNHVR